MLLLKIILQNLAITKRGPPNPVSSQRDVQLTALLLSILLVTDMPPAARGFVLPVVEQIRGATPARQRAQVIVEFAQAVFHVTVIASGTAEFLDVTLQMDDAVGDAQVDLRNIEPVCGNDPARLRYNFHVVKHRVNLTALLRVDKQVVCL